MPSITIHETRIAEFSARVTRVMAERYRFSDESALSLFQETYAQYLRSEYLDSVAVIDRCLGGIAICLCGASIAIKMFDPGFPWKSIGLLFCAVVMVLIMQFGCYEMRLPSLEEEIVRLQQELSQQIVDAEFNRFPQLLE